MVGQSSPWVSAINFKHLRYFWAVAHEGNLTRAAAHLHVSQSAVSTQIRSLEDDLGQTLFERRGKRLLLTEVGRIALDYADAIFALGDEFLGTLSEVGARRRVLRVGALTTLSRNFQIGFLKPLLNRDDVELVVRSGVLGELLRLLEAHQLDVVLSNSAPPRDAATEWVPHTIATQPVSLIGHPDKSVPGRSLDELLTEEPLVLPAVETSIRAGFDALIESRGLRPRIAAEVDDMAMLRLVARAHDGLAVVPPVVVKDELANGSLVEIERLPGLHEAFFAITLRRRFPNPLLPSLLVEGARDRFM